MELHPEYMCIVHKTRVCVCDDANRRGSIVVKHFALLVKGNHSEKHNA